jgi:membrane-bound ClpP family serine protease
MSVLVIVLLIVLGLSLLIIEFFMLPGITIAGIAGSLFIGGGIIIAYRYYGLTGGHWALFSTMLAAGLMFYLSFRAKTWDRLSLKSSIDSAVETVDENTIKAGDAGLSVSRLNPMGKVLVNNQIVEAHCPGQFIDENQPLEVVKVFKTHIIVKPKI